ncbi:hypothetical protein ACFFX0_26845 [Citricoccus parietis]|uniref:Uncharacterized protein n=1 Tax=Citricoccus parietis TaxID=592307 RepID=A0ABV5G6N2_9MICC
MPRCCGPASRRGAVTSCTRGGMRRAAMQQSTGPPAASSGRWNADSPCRSVRSWTPATAP